MRVVRHITKPVQDGTFTFSVHETSFNLHTSVIRIQVAGMRSLTFTVRHGSDPHLSEVSGHLGLNTTGSVRFVVIVENMARAVRRPGGGRPCGCKKR